jgi:hypothetical protein
VPTYVDAESALVNWLAVILDAGPTGTFRRVVTELPGDVFSNTGMPCVLVERFGGADHLPGLDVVRLSVDVYCTGPDPLQARAAAIARGEDVRRAIRLHLPGRTIGGLGGAFVSKVVTESAPTIRPYDSRHQVRRSQASFAVYLHNRL